MAASPDLKAYRRANGLCPLDGLPVKPGRARCVRCCARAVRFARKYRQRCARELLCQEPGCGALAVGGKVRCAACEAVEAIKAKARYEERKAAGICVYRGCGRKTRGGAACCGTCLQSKRRKYAANKEDA